MIADKIPELKNLTRAEKVALATELVQEINGELELFPVRADHVKILEESLAEYERNPQNTIPWEEVRKKYIKEP